MDDDEFKGLIPRSVEQIFANIIASPSTIEFTVKVSYMEIFMEKIRDLLNRERFFVIASLLLYQLYTYTLNLLLFVFFVFNIFSPE